MLRKDVVTKRRYYWVLAHWPKHMIRLMGYSEMGREAVEKCRSPRDDTRSTVCNSEIPYVCSIHCKRML